MPANKSLSANLANGYVRCGCARATTQEELANEAEIGIAQLKRIESGSVNMSISTAARLAGALGVSLPRLFAFAPEN